MTDSKPRITVTIATRRLVLALLLGVGVVVLAAPVASAAPLFTGAELGHATDIHNGEFTGVSMLPDGSSIVAGSYGADAGMPATIDLVGGAPLPATVSNADNGFVAKRSPTGVFLWQTAIATPTFGHVFIQDVATMSDGSAIVAGSYTGSASFGTISVPDPGISNGVLFAAKLRADGSDFAWVRTASGPGQSEATSVTVVADGSVVLGGDFYGTIDVGGFTRMSAGGSDLLATRIPADGSEFSWALIGGGSGDEYAYGGGAYADGSALVAGGCTGTATFGTSVVDCAAGGVDHPLVAKAKADGSGWAWALAPQVGDESDASDAAPLADGGALVAGGFAASATFGATTLLDPDDNGDAYTAAVRPDGTGFVWATQTTGARFSDFTGIATRPDGSAVVTGNYYHDPAGIAVGVVTLNGSATANTFVATLDGAGAFTGAVGAGTTGAWWGWAVSALPDGSAVVSGSATKGGSTATFGASMLTTAVQPGTNNDFFAAGALVAPAAPAAPTAVAGTGSAAVTVVPLVGPSITRYVVTAAPGGRTCAIVTPATSCVVDGLANGTAYRFTATAENAAGSSPSSAASAAVTPVAAAKVASKAPSLTGAPRIVRFGSSVSLVSSVRVGAAGSLSQRATYSSSARAAKTATACVAVKRVKKAGAVTITCALNAKARAALRKGALKLTLTTTFTETGKTAASTTRGVTVPRAKPNTRASHGLLS